MNQKPIFKLILFILFFLPAQANPKEKTFFFTPNIKGDVSYYAGSNIKRIYCSVKSIGFDLHFNSQTGEVYSFDDFSEKLVPFDLNLEVPFGEIIPKEDIQDFLREFDRTVKGPETRVEGNKLMIQISNPSNSNEYIIASIDLDNLKLKFKVSAIDSEEKRNMIIALNQAEGVVKCEYINPESTKLKYLQNNKNYPSYQNYPARY